MRRSVMLVLVFWVWAGSLGMAQDFDISAALQLSFHDIALLPSRLTAYNQHDDAATASYTCCKPYQHKEINQAIRANEVFLDNHPTSDFGDDTCMHYAWVTSVRKDFRAQVEAYNVLLQRYPDSHMADDAAWHLAQLYSRDKDHEAAIHALDVLLQNFPLSTWADDAYMLLVREFNEVDDEFGTMDALEGLAYNHPTSDFCAQALGLLARKYFEVESYDRAIDTCNDLIYRYPMSDWADDAQMVIADALRLQNHLREALDAYEYLIHEMYGSSQANRAMREANNLVRRLRRQGHNIGGDYYDPLEWNPGRDARDLWDRAQHHENYREFSEAIELYRDFIHEFPGNDNFDDAFYRVGECYREMKILFEDINQAKGPEDLFRLSNRYAAATGAYQMVPSADEVGAIQDASGAYAAIINDFHGSPLRDDALYQIAQAYTPWEEPEKVTPNAAYTFQELLLYFPTSPYAFEALVKLVRFYATPKHYEITQQMYPQASAALPGLFPPGLEQDKEALLQLMKLYQRQTEHAWFECHFHHIKYVLTPADMIQPAYYYQAGMLMSRGEFARAAQLLQELVQARTGDFIAPATFLLARCYQYLGNSEATVACLQLLETTYAQSGLADDAALIRTEIAAGEDNGVQHYAEQVAQAYEVETAHLDSYVGDHVVVLAPYSVAPVMRQYNMPNIWEQAQRILEDWCGVSGGGKTIIFVDPTGKRSPGNPMRVSALGIKDPPDWMLGLEQLSHNAITKAICPLLPEQSPVIQGLSQFAAASLQYDLVTETRDAIGSASAVKLPQEAVLRSRDRALKALEEYVRADGERKLNGTVVAGMLYSLLDEQGHSSEQLINREPYRELFANLRNVPDGYPGLPAFGTALDRAFHGAVREQLQSWGLPVASRYYGQTARPAVPVG